MLMKILNIVILTFIALVLCRSEQTEKGFEKEKTSFEFTGVRRAVIIGISDYQNVKKLNYADKDAIRFYSYLVSKAGGLMDSSNIRLLLNEDASFSKVWYSIAWLINESKAGDQAIFYFSGHGDVEDSSMFESGFLLCSEVNQSCYNAAGIEVDALRKKLIDLSYKNVKTIVIIDACRSGSLSGWEFYYSTNKQNMGEYYKNTILKKRVSYPGKTVNGTVVPVFLLWL